MTTDRVAFEGVDAGLWGAHDIREWRCPVVERGSDRELGWAETWAVASMAQGMALTCVLRLEEGVEREGPAQVLWMDHRPKVVTIRKKH